MTARCFTTLLTAMMSRCVISASFTLYWFLHERSRLRILVISCLLLHRSHDPYLLATSLFPHLPAHKPQPTTHNPQPTTHNMPPPPSTVPLRLPSTISPQAMPTQAPPQTARITTNPESLRTFDVSAPILRFEFPDPASQAAFHRSFALTKTNADKAKFMARWFDNYDGQVSIPKVPARWDTSNYGQTRRHHPQTTTNILRSCCMLMRHRHRQTTTWRWQDDCRRRCRCL
jgi:hypothetical protein